MRNDDPGNLVYAATGSEIFYIFNNMKFQQAILKGAAEWYALQSAGKFGKEEPSMTTEKLVAIKASHDRNVTQPWLLDANEDLQSAEWWAMLGNKNGVDFWREFLPKVWNLNNLDVALFDDAHDIAVINWGYEAYADGSLKSIVKPLDFRKALKFLQKKGS